MATVVLRIVEVPESWECCELEDDITPYVEVISFRRASLSQWRDLLACLEELSVDKGAIEKGLAHDMPNLRVRWLDK